MNKNRVFGFKAKKDKDMGGGKTVKAGTEMVRGVACPQCKTFYKHAFRLSACNVCGWRNKKNAKPHEVKDYLKKVAKVNAEMDDLGRGK